MDLEFRAVQADEIETFYNAMSVPFSFDPEKERFAMFRDFVERDRMRAAFDGDQLVGTFGAHSLHLTVPGGSFPVAGTSIVTVLPTHRRRGILRTLMTEHLREVHGRGEPLAALWSAEAPIYGRFGFGPATERVATIIEKPYAELQSPPEITGQMRLINKQEASEKFPAIFEQVAANRVGMFRRSEKWWRLRILLDLKDMREGGTAQRLVLHERDGQPVGYLIFRSKIAYELHQQKVIIRELVGSDAEAEKALWQFAYGIDLVQKIEAWNQPLDTPLRWWLKDSRKLTREVYESLWVRIVDLPKALSGRRYLESGSLTFSFDDELCPWNAGTWRLDVDADGVGHCEKTTASADLGLTPYALGSAYLGGHSFSDLARCGVSTGKTEQLKLADAMFRWHQVPWCHEVF